MYELLLAKVGFPLRKKKISQDSISRVHGIAIYEQ